MDIQRSIEMQNLQPADVALQGYSGKGTATMLAALIAWEKRRGIHIGNKSWGHSSRSQGMANLNNKKSDTIKLPKAPHEHKSKVKLELTVDQKLKLREFNRIRTARYRAANREDVRLKNKEHARRYTASMTPEQKASRLANERRWRVERKNRKQQAV